MKARPEKTTAHLVSPPYTFFLVNRVVIARAEWMRESESRVIVGDTRPVLECAWIRERLVDVREQFFLECISESHLSLEVVRRHLLQHETVR